MTLPKDVLFESFTFPFFDAAYPASLGTTLANSFLGTAEGQSSKGRRGLYVHIPFCETICSFCPFVKFVPHRDQIADYVESLIKECALVLSSERTKQWVVDSIYFGGGTPSLLSPTQVSAILDVIRAHVHLAPDVEVTLETEPKSTDRQKLEAYRQAGITRTSFGIQSFNPVIRKMMNLTASQAQVIEAISATCEVFENTNFDMIVGFPGQLSPDVDKDMRLAARSGIGSVSMYPFDYVTALPKLLDRMRAGKIPSPPKSAERWELFHRARAVLAESLSPQNMYCFGNPDSPKCRYMFETLYGGYFDQVIGLGCGSYTYLTGVVYQNDQTLKSYQESLAREVLPIVRASPTHAYEKHFVYFPKRLYANLQEARDLGILDWITPRLEYLSERGMISSDSDLVHLTPQGERHYAQIMVFMLSEYQRRLYERACSRLSSGLNWSHDGPGSNEPSVIRGPAAKSAVRV